MGYYFARHLLLRMPKGNAAGYTTDLSVILADRVFRTALLVASPVLYARLEQSGFRAELLTERQCLTVQKYYNRFCYRPTPFGLFSSVTLADWGNIPGFATTEVSYEALIRTDQRYQAVLSFEILQHEEVADALFDPNPSIYRVLNEFRFLRSSLDETFSSRNYSLQSIAYSKLLGDLIHFAQGGKSGSALILFIVTAAVCTPEEADAYLEFLVDAQVLLNYSRPNITGADFLDQIPDKRTAAISRMLFREHTIEERHLLNLKSGLRHFLPDVKQGYVQDELSIILNRYSTGEVLSQRVQSQIKSGIDALAVLVPEEKNAGMAAFTRQFNTYFEGQCIPLLTALDPEAGIGYQVPETDRNNPLLETLHIPVNTPVDDTIKWTAAHSLLLERWHGEQYRQSGVIRLQDADLVAIQPEGNAPQVAGMSVLFRISGEQVMIESAGGNNAPALMGRFTIGDPAITDAARVMAKSQETQNPGVIFAEILHLSDPHTDNINRREQIWHYELPLTARSLLPAERQLELSDLYVAVHENRVFLYSKKHHKVVVPRLSSAYNHGLNKLPLFRFLADIPYQYGRNSFFFDLRRFFPGLGFYPRVEYQDIILFSATWILRETQLSKLSKEMPDKSLPELQLLREELRIPDMIAIADGDQHLHFDFRNHQETIFFLHCIRNKIEIVLKEVIADEPVRQYNAYLMPDQALVLPPPGIFKFHSGERPGPQRKYIPGSEWLYVKIYAPRIGASRLLLKLRPILRKKFGHGTIQKWFFIRYEDHAPHLRLRMKVNPEDIQEILDAFKGKLEDRIRQHVVREYQVDVYSRELERYSFGGIEKTEAFFWTSSELVMQAIGAAADRNDLFLFALKSTLAILEEFIQQPDTLLDFCYRSYAHLLTEFKVAKLHVELDRKYRQLQNDITHALDDKNEKYLNPKRKTVRNFRRSLVDLADSPVDNTAERLQFLGSIVHMHVNRVFAGEPRKQEMITYYLLYKFLLAKKGKARQNSETSAR